MSYIHFGTFRIDDAVDKAGTFTGVCEVVGLMCRPNVKDSLSHALYLVSKGTSSRRSDAVSRLLHGKLNIQPYLCPLDSP